MFRNHQPIIGDWAQNNPRALALVGAFVIFTIKTPLERAIVDYHAYRDHGDTSALWSWKLEAVQEFERNAAQRHTALCERRLGRPGDRDALLATVALWRGFSFVKGGFLLQLVFGVSGCIDTHHERRLGVSIRHLGLSAPGRTAPTRTRKARAYHRLVDHAGGTEQLWNDWCRYVARERGSVWTDAHEVSRHHALSLLPPGEIGSGYVNGDIPF